MKLGQYEVVIPCFLYMLMVNVDGGLLLQVTTYGYRTYAYFTVASYVEFMGSRLLAEIDGPRIQKTSMYTIVEQLPYIYRLTD